MGVDVDGEFTNASSDLLIHHLVNLPTRQRMLKDMLLAAGVCSGRIQGLDALVKSVIALGRKLCKNWPGENF